MMQGLYDRVMRLSARPDAIYWLAAIAFVESSVFPIPPDILIIPMVLARRERAFWIATVCTVASVLGGFLGYAIGYFAFETLGKPVLEFYGAMAKYESLKETFDHWGAWFIIIKGATPIPYKLVTIFSGTVKFDLLKFALSSLISRAIRFYLLAFLLWRFGPPIRDFIERRLMLVTTGFVALLVGGFVVIRYVV